MTDRIGITANGRSIDCVFRTPEGMTAFPVVILGHGYNSTLDAFSSDMEFFAGNGIGAAAFNFCGGSLSDRSGFPTTSMTLTTEKEDLLAVYNYIISTGRADRVFLFGSSQGGMVSALAAEELGEKISGLMLQFPAFCIPDDWSRKFPGGLDIPEVYDMWGMNIGSGFIREACSMELPQAVGTYPGDVLLMHGDRDDIVSIRYSEWAQKAYKNARLEIFPGQGHGFSEPENMRMNKMCLEFIKAHCRT
ncbi:MAG: alpha/beta hydrolase [Oscillospiraceae bacterium]|nr:alpha/beta hydrolase [Oscillospiraceae bacterium]